MEKEFSLNCLNFDDFVKADSNAIGWMILKTIYELKGAKSFPVYIFHLLRKKGFCQLTIS